MNPRHLAFAAAGCVVLAAASLLVAHEPVYDAWAWLVWGRELAGLDLDISSGPSWKPLPVAVCALLSLAGDAAPVLWVVLVRAAWLLALVLAGGLAYRLTAGLERRLRLAAAGFAALSLLLLADDFTSWTRQGAAGMSEPLLVALVLGAVAAVLDGRSRAALALGALAALIRPEVWALLGVYGLWRWRPEPALRPWLAAAAVAVPVLWLGPDLLASGNRASAGTRALRGGGAPVHELLEVLWRAAQMPLLAAWPLAVLAVVRRPGRTALRVLGPGALAWIAIVAVMAAGGFPGLPRFMAPAIAIAGVLAGVGLARLLAPTTPADAAPAPAAAAPATPVDAAPAPAAAAPATPVDAAPAPAAAAPAPATAAEASTAHASRPRLAALALVAAAIVTIVQLPGRAEDVPHALSVTARVARSHDDLRALARAVGRERLLRCGKLATSDVLVRTALAWELDVALPRVVSFGAFPKASGAFVIGPQATPRVRAFMRARAELLGTRGEWSVYSLACPRPAPASSFRAASRRSLSRSPDRAERYLRSGAAASSSSASVRSAGVSGAQR
ncbi:MAG TPA: hypothetical protein VGO80_10235 [Solirubrobacteraceae bacterium]|jgi:hypothetical protein|nr:hypothetical protein [Solirubrobacteraceae bacterium]